MQWLIHVIQAALPLLRWPGWTEPIYSEMFVLITVCCHPSWQMKVLCVNVIQVLHADLYS